MAAVTVRGTTVSLSLATGSTLQPLQIKSVVAPEHVKGYIYVEAYKQTHVKQAIEGVGNLRLGYWNQQMVPIKEMTDVLKVVKEVANLKPKSWVRLKRGIYKDDIAQVLGLGQGREAEDSGLAAITLLLSCALPFSLKWMNIFCASSKHRE